jgi:hypothetical protein
MCGFVSFIPGHLIMVVIHGWAGFASMFTGVNSKRAQVNRGGTLLEAYPHPDENFVLVAFMGISH